MTRTLVFTDRAMNTLRDILVWTHDAFGPRQVERYEQQLVQRLEDYTKGQATDRSLETLTGLENHRHFRALRAGEHFAILTVTPETVAVIDFIHTRADLPSFAQPDPDDA